MTLHVNDLFIFSGLRFGKFLGISFMHSHTEQSDFRILMKPISYNYPILQGRILIAIRMDKKNGFQTKENDLN